jgi:antitoxin (DNA-binding transcriptional repressor) of toxin-antitoxin stability system
VSATTKPTLVSASPAGAAPARISPRGFSCAYIRGVREIPLDQAPSEIAAAARAAARGQIVYLTEHGERLAAIVPPEFAAEIEDLSPDEVLELLDDLSGAPAVGESSSDTDAGRDPMTDS